MTNNPGITHHLLLIDESGSMQKISQSVIEKVQHMLHTIRDLSTHENSRDHRVTLMTFNGEGIRTHFYNVPANQTGTFPECPYEPKSSTALYDCLGQGIALMKGRLWKDKHRTRIYVTLLTDGCDTGSVKYSASSMSKMITQLTRQGWTFSCVGSKETSNNVCIKLGIKNRYISPFVSNDQGRSSIKTYLARKALMKEVEKKESKEISYAA